MYVLQDGTCVNHDAVVCKVDFTDAVEFGQVQQNAVFGHRRPAQSGIAALRGNGNFVFETEAYDVLHAFHGTRLQYDVGGGRKPPALVGKQVGGRFGNFVAVEEEA